MSHTWKGGLTVAFLKWQMVTTLFFYKRMCCSSTAKNNQNINEFTTLLQQSIYRKTRHVCAARFNVSCILQCIIWTEQNIISILIFRQNANFRSKLFDRFTHQSVPDGHQFVTDNETTVYLSSTAVHDFGYINPIVARYMLIADTAGNAEAEALVTLDKLDLH